MFKKLKQLFKKEQETVAGIVIYVDTSGETFVDVRMKDDSDESIDHLASILIMFDTSSFFQVSSVLRQQCESNKTNELYSKVIKSVVSKAGPEKLLTNYEQDDDDLCINPSDMI